MAAVAHSSTTVSPTHRAYQILHFGFTVAPIIAGADKFFDKLGDWDKYLAPQIANIIPAHTFMMIVGAIGVVLSLVFWSSWGGLGGGGGTYVAGGRRRRVVLDEYV